MPYSDKSPPHARSGYLSINIMFSLTQAKLALADGNLELARKKFEEVLEIDPNNAEALEFLQTYSRGREENKPEADIVKDCRKNADGTCVLLEIPKPKAPSKRRKMEKDFRIEEVFIITLEGLLVGHFTSGETHIGDADIMVGMLTALQMFMLEAFNDEDLRVKTLHLNKFDVYFAQGEWVTICVVASGRNTASVADQLESFKKEVERTYKDVFPAWGGNMSQLKALKPMTIKLITGGYV